LSRPKLSRNEAVEPYEEEEEYITTGSHIHYHYGLTHKEVLEPAHEFAKKLTKLKYPNS
jgi:ribosomal protein S4